MRTVTLWIQPVLLLALGGCSGTSITNVSPGSGGTAAAGGPSSTAGTSTTNQASTGGLVSNGGALASGGTTSGTAVGGISGISAGGSLPIGGSNSTGGISGVASSGGTSTATLGGFSATGGTSATTGLTHIVTGGSSNTGGASLATGGANIGGMSALTGGASTTGGTSAATGGTTAATGGTSAATGGANTGGIGTATTGLLANCSLLLHMDEAAWSSTPGEARDASGAGNNGTAMIGANTGSVARFGRAGLFDGDGYVTVTSSDSLHGMAAFSIAAWFYPTFLDGTTRAPGIVAKRWAWNDSSEFALFLGEENRLWVDIMTEDNRFSSATVFNMAEWYHVAVVFDGSLAADKRVSVYVNGQLDVTGAESSSVVVPYDSPLEVGRLRDGGQGFIGSIDEVALWQRALSAAEVLSIYERTEPL